MKIERTEKGKITKKGPQTDMHRTEKKQKMKKTMEWNGMD